MYLNKQIKTKPAMLRHGTPFNWLEFDSRNSTLFFYDAEKEKVIPPFERIHEYGTIPPRFRVEEGGFGPETLHKSGSIGHNTYITLGDSLVKQIKTAVETTGSKTVDITVNDLPCRVTVKDPTNIGNIAEVETFSTASSPCEITVEALSVVGSVGKETLKNKKTKKAYTSYQEYWNEQHPVKKGGSRRSTRRRSTRRRSTRY